MIIAVAFIRSGITDAGFEDRFLGSIDEPLSKQGEKSLRLRVSKNIYPTAELVFVSGYARSLSTAQIIYPNIPAVVIGELEPYNYGRFSGKSFGELEEDEEFEDWISNKCLSNPPDGEELNVFTARCVTAFRKIIKETERKALSSIAIVTHLSVIRRILRRYHMPRPLYQDWQIDFGSGFLTNYDTKTGILTISDKF